MESLSEGLCNVFMMAASCLLHCSRSWELLILPTGQCETRAGDSGVVQIYCMCMKDLDSEHFIETVPSIMRLQRPQCSDRDSTNGWLDGQASEFGNHVCPGSFLLAFESGL